MPKVNPHLIMGGCGMLTNEMFHALLVQIPQQSACDSLTALAAYKTFVAGIDVLSEACMILHVNCPLKLIIHALSQDSVSTCELRYVLLLYMRPETVQNTIVISTSGQRKAFLTKSNLSPQKYILLRSTFIAPLIRFNQVQELFPQIFSQEAFSEEPPLYTFELAPPQSSQRAQLQYQGSLD